MFVRHERFLVISARHVVTVVAVALVAVIMWDTLVFRSGWYAQLLDPMSAAGTFEDALRRARGAANGSATVLVIGDSRIAIGFSAGAASQASGLAFVNAGVPGTTPRCWRVFIRALDAPRQHIRAVVIPVDTYSDDSGALGALDAWDHIDDLRYVMFHLRPVDIPWFVSSVHDPLNRMETLRVLATPGTLERSDVQNFVADPKARFDAIAAKASGRFEAESTTLEGITADFSTNSMRFPSDFSDDLKAKIEENVLPIPASLPSYGEYRRMMLGDAADRLRASGVPVVFVRIPTRPWARPARPAAPSGALREIADRGGVTLLPQAPYLRLEQPRYFSDEHHLNVEGRELFSAQLGRDVAHALDRRG